MQENKPQPEIKAERRKSMASLEHIDSTVHKDEISGFLHKRRGGYGKHMPNSWQYRYFIVRDGWMYYFEEKKINARPRGKIDLQSELVTLVVNLHFEHSPTPHTLLINPGGYEEKWKLCAANSEDMDQWCACINGYINNKHKRKGTVMKIPDYNSDSDEQCSETSDEDSICLDRLSTKDPHDDLPERARSPKNKSPKTVSFQGEKKSSSKQAPTGPGSKVGVKGKDSLSATAAAKAASKFRSADTSDTSESILTILILNLCVIFASLSDKMLLKGAYFVLANTVVAHTLYLRSNRVDKQNKELKTLTTAKDKAEGLAAKQAAKLATLEKTLADSVVALPDSVLIEDEKVVDDSPRVPGSTVKQVFGVPADEPPHTWCRCDPTAFNVRTGPNYSKFKKKTPSGMALYEPFAVDTFCARKNVDHIAKLMALPDMQNVNTNHSKVPPIMIVQMQLPTDSPPLFGSVEDGPGWAVVFYFKITEDTCNQLKDLSTASAAVKLFVKYCENAEKDFAWRSRLKMIGCCSNLEELGVPGAIATYNAKPVMIKKTGSIYRGESYLEVNINVHKWPTYVQKCIQFMYSQSTLMFLQVGFVIEGREDEDLPETLFGCVGVNRPDEEQAEFFFRDEIEE